MKLSKDLNAIDAMMKIINMTSTQAVKNFIRDEKRKDVLEVAAARLKELGFFGEHTSGFHTI